MLPVPTLPEGREGGYEIKLDRFRLRALKQKGKTTFFSRRGNILHRKFPYIAAALEGLLDDTILDGEVVALDEQGRSDFSLLQNFRSAASKISLLRVRHPGLEGQGVCRRWRWPSGAIFWTKRSRATITAALAGAGGIIRQDPDLREAGRPGRRRDQTIGQLLRARQALARLVQIPNQLGEKLGVGGTHAAETDSMLWSWLLGFVPATRR
jgi:ATP dependent DNA ligase domain